MNKIICTPTGIFLYRYFIEMGGIKSTDPNFDYYLPDYTTFRTPNEVEDWIILKAKQIENECIQSLLNRE